MSKGDDDTLVSVASFSNSSSQRSLDNSTLNYTKQVWYILDEKYTHTHTHCLSWFLPVGVCLIYLSKNTIFVCLRLQICMHWFASIQTEMYFINWFYFAANPDDPRLLQSTHTPDRCDISRSSIVSPKDVRWYHSSSE